MINILKDNSYTRNEFFIHLSIKCLLHIYYYSIYAEYLFLVFFTVKNRVNELLIEMNKKIRKKKTVYTIKIFILHNCANKFNMRKNTVYKK